MLDSTAQNASVASPATESNIDLAQNQGTDSPAVPVQAENDTPKSLLDTVKDAIAASNADKQAAAGDEEQSPGSKGNQGGEPGEPAEKEAVEGGEKDGGDTAKRGKGFDARIKQLVTERDSFRSRAEQWDRLSQWARESGLQSDELAQTLALAQMVKQAPHEALNVLRGVMAELEKRTGYELPPDLAAKVENGLIDEETARELSVGRSKVAMTEAQRAKEIEQRRAEAEFQERQALAYSIGKSVTDLERSLESSDPDYPKIKSLVKAKVVELMHTEGVPASAGDAVEQVKRAVAAVKSDLADVLPQRRATRPTPMGSSQGQSGATPVSSLEAARMALSGQAPRY